MSIWAGTTGQLDDVPVEDVRRFETEFLDYLQRDRTTGILTAIRETLDLPDDTDHRAQGRDRASSASGFETSSGELLLVGDDEQADAARRGEGAGDDRHAQAAAALRQTPRRRVGAMAAQLRVVRARIRAVQSIAKITRAQELIASSRIVQAQQRTRAAEPYARELTTAVEAVVSRSATITHPMTNEPETPDAGRGAHPHQRRRVRRRLQRQRAPRGQPAPARRSGDDGVAPVNYVAGRKGISWHRFRDLDLAADWSGFSAAADLRGRRGGRPTALLDAFETDAADGGVDEIYLVSTEFVSMLTQRPAVARLLPLQIEETEGERPGGPLPSYEFEPSTDVVLDALLPQYVASRIYYAMLEAAASELAARRRAMKAATDNANDLIDRLTREANNARQAEITQEISEIVGGANALAEANAGSE